MINTKDKRYSLSDKITFGKHRDSTIEYLCEYHNRYIGWCLSSIDSFLLTDSSFNRYQEFRTKMLNNTEHAYNNYSDGNAHDCPGSDMGMHPSDFGVPNC